MDLETFQNSPMEEVARLVREGGPRVCVLPVNGTRRWFLLEHQRQDDEADGCTYVDAAFRCHIRLHSMLFDHGVNTILCPLVGPDVIERGGAYVEMTAQGLIQLATAPHFVEFYEAYDVCVRFYGDYRRFLASTQHAYPLDLLDEATRRTLSHSTHRLFWGAFAHDATEAVAQIAVEYYQQHGRAPDKRALVAEYYGEYVEPVDLFLGFDKFAAFDYPLLGTGEEDLYFTVAPSCYLTQRQLREILYDHLFARRCDPGDYAQLGPDTWAFMRRFYDINRGRTLGVGADRGGVWFPTPQVTLPEVGMVGEQQETEAIDEPNRRDP